MYASDQDIEEFFGRAEDQKHGDQAQEEAEEEPKPSKKRRRKDKAPKPSKEAKLKAQQEEDQDLRKRARFFCSSPEQYKVVAKYNLSKLKEWVQDAEFRQKKELAQTVFDTAHRFLAAGLDKLTRGDGFVESQILNDLTLRQSIEEEGYEYLAYVENKVRLLVLTVLDTVNGKRLQIRAGGGAAGGGPVIEQEEAARDNGGEAPQEAQED